MRLVIHGNHPDEKTIEGDAGKLIHLPKSVEDLLSLAGDYIIHLYISIDNWHEFICSRLTNMKMNATTCTFNIKRKPLTTLASFDVSTQHMHLPCMHFL